MTPVSKSKRLIESQTQCRGKSFKIPTRTFRLRYRHGRSSGVDRR